MHVLVFVQWHFVLYVELLELFTEDGIEAVEQLASS